MTAPGVVVDGLRLASVSVEPTNQFDDARAEALVLPDGSQWFPQGAFALDGDGDLPFSDKPIPTFSVPPLSSTPDGTMVSETTLAEMLVAARGPVAATGTFTDANGVPSSRLDLPAGSRLASVCLAGAELDPPCQESAIEPTLTISVGVVEGTEVRVAGDGEVMVGGAASATALGRTWEGHVVSLDAGVVDASAQYRDGGWAVAGASADARQLWVDAWPVVDTVLSGISTTQDADFFESIFDTNDLRIKLHNVGFASSQILEVEGTGPGASQVGFGLARSGAHDAGLGVRRGGRTVNLADGGAVESELRPGGRLDRGLRFEVGSPATITLRGNFPEVVVPLDIDGASRE